LAMRRFSYNNVLHEGDKIFLSLEESRHISKVLRLKIGEMIELFDYSGTIYSASIVDISQRVAVEIVSERTLSIEGSGKIIVCQSIIKNKKMELLLQKCTELGVSELFPFVSSRCQGNVVQQYSGKGERWRKIIEESCKQCLRPLPMLLRDIHTFTETLQYYKEDEKTIKLLLWEKEKGKNLTFYRDQLPGDKRVLLLFGPEGGFTEEEIFSARECGWQTVGLGDNILRAETAVIAAVSIVQHLLGNM